LNQLQTTQVFGAAAEAIELYNEYLTSNGGLINSLAEMQQQEQEATTELNLLKGAFEDTTKDAQKFGETIGDEGSGGGGGGKKTVIGAFEALTKRAGELQTAIRNSLASGDLAGASELTRLLDDLQGKIGFLEAQMEGLNRPIETTMAAPKFVDDDGNEYDSYEDYLRGDIKKFNTDPPKVKLN